MMVILFCLYASLSISSCKGTVNLPKDVSVQAVFVFGDSTMDTGNNNYIETLAKANFPPYGRDFMGGNPTGRFSNGKILADVFAKGLGVKEYLPAYLDPSIQDHDLRTGVSFASAGSGYDPLTTNMTVYIHTFHFYKYPFVFCFGLKILVSFDNQSVIPLPIQLDMFKEYMGKLIRNNGNEAADNIITNSVFLVSASTNDFLVNYFLTPTRSLQYDVRAYGKLLVELATRFVQDLHKLGARKIAVLSAAPIGCVPFERTLAGGPQRKCVDKYNKAAQVFNSILNKQIQLLASSLPQSRVAIVDFYNPLISILENAQQYGLEVTDRGCCGTGDVEASYLCDQFCPTCSNTSKFIFWDSIHPTEKAYGIYVDIILPDLVKSLF